MSHWLLKPFFFVSKQIKATGDSNTCTGTVSRSTAPPEPPGATAGSSPSSETPRSALTLPVWGAPAAKGERGDRAERGGQDQARGTEPGQGRVPRARGVVGARANEVGGVAGAWPEPLPVAAAGAEVQSPVRPGQVRWDPLFQLRQVPWGLPASAGTGAWGGAGRRHTGAMGSAGWAGTGVPGPAGWAGTGAVGPLPPGSAGIRARGGGQDRWDFPPDCGGSQSRTRCGRWAVGESELYGASPGPPPAICARPKGAPGLGLCGGDQRQSPVLPPARFGAGDRLENQGPGLVAPGAVRGEGPRPLLPAAAGSRRVRARGWSVMPAGGPFLCPFVMNRSLAPWESVFLSGCFQLEGFVVCY